MHFIGNLSLITLNNANIRKEWSYFIWFEIINFVGLNFEVTGELALKTNFWPAFKDDCHMVGHGFHPGLDPITCKNAVFFIDYREYLLRFTMILLFFSGIILSTKCCMSGEGQQWSAVKNTTRVWHRARNTIKETSSGTASPTGMTCIWLRGPWQQPTKN